MPKNDMIQIQFPALGTMNSIKLFSFDHTNILDKVTKRIYEIEDTMSVFIPTSDIARLNMSAGNEFVEIKQDTFNLLKRAIEFSELSQGCFDITIGPLVSLWGISKKMNYIPSTDLITQEKFKVNYQGILLDYVHSRAALRHSGQSVDLGGIAKGYAAEEAKRILLENGVQHALINLGGNILTIGYKEGGSPWKIGIQNPLQPNGRFLGTLSIENKTVVTSGANERFFIKDGVRYHHILDPHTGYPSKSGLLSVTVVCNNSTDADALTTSLFVLGLEKGLKLLKKVGGEAVFITDKMEIYMTNGLRNNFQISEVSKYLVRLGG